MNPHRLSDAEAIFELLEKLRHVRVLVAGDIMLDRYIWGKSDRLSPEAPVPVVDAKRIEDRLGGAANAARNLRGLGVQVSLCGLVGDDAEGRTVVQLLEQAGIDHEGVLIERNRPTTFKTRVMVGMYQMVRVDREDATMREQPMQHGLAAVMQAQAAGCDAVIISDYGKGAVCPHLIERATAATTTSSSKIPVIVDPNKANFSMYRGITIAKPNKKEAEAATGITISDRSSAFKVAWKLREQWQASMMMVTLAEMGLVLVGPDEGEEFHLPTEAREVFDVSGAGDCVTAVFTAFLAAGASPLIAGMIANIAAGMVVSELGTVAITHDRLREKLRSILAEHPERLAIL
jgi:D-beta-D-heptose 7-phosphate kinase/D-beta-D-heptose 1-phosphate adenosyltransferase